MEKRTSLHERCIERALRCLLLHGTAGKKADAIIRVGLKSLADKLIKSELVSLTNLVAELDKFGLKLKW